LSKTLYISIIQRGCSLYLFRGHISCSGQPEELQPHQPRKPITQHTATRSVKSTTSEVFINFLPAHLISQPSPKLSNRGLSLSQTASIRFCLELKYNLSYRKDHKKSLLVFKAEETNAKQASSPHLSPPPTDHHVTVCPDSTCPLGICNDHRPKPAVSHQLPILLTIMPQHRVAEFSSSLPLSGSGITDVLAIAAGIH
jgi:hypothetical protein